MYIGIDLGTSSVKLVLVNSSGEVIKIVSNNYPLIIPKQGFSEQDPNEWYIKTIDALEKIVIGYEDQIKAISFSGQMHGMVILDKNDEVIRNAILWNDQRTIKEVDFLNNKIGKEKLFLETGNIALTGLTLPKVLWLYNNEIDNFNKINKLMLPKDYLSYKLSGVFATDESDVSGTLYYDVKNKIYSKYMVDLMKLKEENLPKVYKSYEVIGCLKEDIAKKLKLNNDVKVIIGGGDQAVGAVGVGSVKSGVSNISLGTSGVVFASMDNFSPDYKLEMQSYAHSNGKYHIMGVMLNAAGALKWWLEEVLKENNYDYLFENIKTTPIDDTLYFLPYLSGERAPVNNPSASASFLGLRQDHRREHLSRAVVEGISFNLKEILKNIEDKVGKISKARVIGGGARSKVWLQMLSDILNIELETIESSEGPAYGAAILAMVGDGLYKDLEEATNSLIKIKDNFIPIKENVNLYNLKYDKYQKLYNVVKDVINKE